MRKIIFMGIFASLIRCALAQQVQPLDHGFRTSRVIATRYLNSESKSWSIGFKYPMNPADCDRSELSDFMELHGGNIYQSGGYPGAEMHVAFKDVKDMESANQKIREIILPLSKLITDLGAGKKVSIVVPGRKQWPDTDPLDKSDPYWEFNNNLNIDGIPYEKSEISPGRWQWIIDLRSLKAARESDERRQKLWEALSTRVLNDEEWRQVLAYGDSINVENWVPYNPADKMKERNEAYLQQQRLRLEASK